MESGFGPLYLFKGTEGRLKCNPKAAPRPSKDQYKWYKGTTLLTSSPPYRIVHGEFSTLIIDNVDKNRDEGLYKCYAENFLGNDEATATATVLGENVMHVSFRYKVLSIQVVSRIETQAMKLHKNFVHFKYSLRGNKKNIWVNIFVLYAKYVELQCIYTSNE